ncbi:MAG: hypothetical protein AAF583_15925 [Pseudomonadota bacterium]
MVELLAIAVITSIGRPLEMASLLRDLAMCLSGHGPDRREPDENGYPSPHTRLGNEFDFRGLFFFFKVMCAKELA